MVIIKTRFICDGGHGYKSKLHDSKQFSANQRSLQLGIVQKLKSSSLAT